MIYHEEGWPAERTFPYKGGQCHIRFFINWAEKEGKAVVTSLEPMWEVNESVWAAFLVWAESQLADWAEDIAEVIADARDTERAAWWRGL